MEYVHEESHHNNGLFHCKHCKKWLWFPGEIGKSCPGPKRKATKKKRV